LIAIKFLVRLVEFLIAAGILALIIIGVTFVLTWLFRIVVTFLEKHLGMQLSWLHSQLDLLWSKLPRRKKKRRKVASARGKPGV
jgi:hypothetical protein